MEYFPMIACRSSRRRQHSSARLGLEARQACGTLSSDIADAPVLDNLRLQKNKAARLRAVECRYELPEGRWSVRVPLLLAHEQRMK